jgi:hypothetical protein
MQIRDWRHVYAEAEHRAKDRTILICSSVSDEDWIKLRRLGPLFFHEFESSLTLIPISGVGDEVWFSSVDPVDLDRAELFIKGYLAGLGRG